VHVVEVIWNAFIERIAADVDEQGATTGFGENVDDEDVVEARIAQFSVEGELNQSKHLSAQLSLLAVSTAPSPVGERRVECHEAPASST